jgi:UDP-2,3-diacylglucosamine pyrophosphatase LpxH
MHAVFSDHHYPYHCPEVEDLCLEFIKENKPDVIHLLGDIVDFYQISRFDKDPARVTQLQGDIDMVVQYLYKLRDVAPSTPIIFSGGNHEDRLRRFLWSEAPALSSLTSLQIPELFSFKHFKIDWKPYPKPYAIGKLLLGHGTIVRKWSAYSARGHYEKYGCCFLHGHTHRMGAFHHTNYEGQYAAYENGCLCSLDPDYTEQPDWQNGFSVVWKARNEFFHVDQVPIVEGQYLWQGQHMISSRRNK